MTLPYQIPINAQGILVENPRFSIRRTGSHPEYPWQIRFKAGDGTPMVTTVKSWAAAIRMIQQYYTYGVILAYEEKH